eukprot:gnl/Carplike_NY0171/4117_a5568_397.p1 GENE.gnl/Carplike_NY0171/4117_a5568_397~~gnl/Carplike_NY0171/4117_a5568_397.p1  ORF type:complete len:287 (+),score=45.54 gnl/Carplike_NY0171/4117_a5568_397:31-861(+)
MKDLLFDLSGLKRPEIYRFTAKNFVYPFEDPSKLEKWAGGKECSLFMYGNNQKKRPNSLTLGRLFEDQIYDMYEFNITDFKSRTEECFRKVPTRQISSRPLIIFQGDAWMNDPISMDMRPFLLDYFRGFEQDKMSLHSVEQVIVFTSNSPDQSIAVTNPLDTPRNVHMRVYHIDLQKGESALIPASSLTECGPRISMKLTRYREPDKLVKRSAEYVFKERLQMKKDKTFFDTVGQKKGRLYVDKQDLSKIALRKFKGLGKAKKRQYGEGKGMGSKK